MIDAALKRVPTIVPVAAVYALLAAVAVAVAFAAGLQAHDRVITRTVNVPTPKPIRSLADLERALGTPDGQTQQGCPGWRLGSTTVIACAG